MEKTLRFTNRRPQILRIAAVVLSLSALVSCLTARAENPHFAEIDGSLIREASTTISPKETRLSGPDAFIYYAGLLAGANLGHAAYERAAFLVRDSDGHVRAILWKGADRGMATFSGPIPEYCIAVMHTHPIGDNEPSRGDRLEAIRIQLPIIVVTPEAVTVAWPDGTMSYLARRTGWNAGLRRVRL
jgi:hypothetical protein